MENNPADVVVYEDGNPSPVHMQGLANELYATGEVSESYPHSNQVHYNEIFEILYYRYGFVLQESGAGSQADDAGQANINMSDGAAGPDIENQWRLITKLIASNTAAMPDVVRPVQLAVNFINTFIKKESTSDLDICSTWDLSTECAYYPLHDITEKKSLLRVTRESDDNGTCYIISPKDKDDDDAKDTRLFWTLIVHDPITALETLRRNLGPKIESVVNFFVHSGIPFNTTISSNTYPPPPRLRLSPPVSLGIRLRSFAPDAMEYRLYEAARDDFLRGPVGRAALLKGGILWRLAKGVVPIHEVFDGPTQLAKDFGQLVHVSKGQDMIDDDLSDEQTSLISGLYQITYGNQMKEVSWWPRHTTWKGCGLDVGYWSSSCETWFQNRLQAIHNGTGIPRTTREWKNALTYQRKTIVLIENAREAADSFLSMV